MKLEIDNDIYKIVERITCSAVEQQENIIMETIQEIGGEEYRHITIDKNKVIEAFEKQIPRKPIDIQKSVVMWGICPICKGERNMLGNRPNRMFCHDNFCSDCGQRLDWSDAE